MSDQFSEMFQEAFWEVWGPVLDEWLVKWREEAWMNRTNDFHIFQESFVGIQSILDSQTDEEK